MSLLILCLLKSLAIENRSRVKKSQKYIKQKYHSLKIVIISYRKYF